MTTRGDTDGGPAVRTPAPAVSPSGVPPLGPPLLPQLAPPLVPSTPPRRRPRSRFILLLALLAGALLGFIALGTWQIERRTWKLDLIRRVEARIHAPAGDAPSPAAWPARQPADEEYRHVRVTGVFEPAAATRVQAVTDLGPGFWLMTPLRRADDGSAVLVNRGFVAGAAAAGPARATEAPATPVAVTGLLRLSEPGGGFLRRNDAAADRWYSRDVAAIAAARRLAGPVAPYFIDAEAPPPGRPAGPDQPVGGLTVVSFHNNHLVYALTWYGLAALAGLGVWRVLRADEGG